MSPFSDQVKSVEIGYILERKLTTTCSHYCSITDKNNCLRLPVSVLCSDNHPSFAHNAEHLIRTLLKSETETIGLILDITLFNYTFI